MTEAQIAALVDRFYGRVRQCKVVRLDVPDAIPARRNIFTLEPRGAAAA